MPTNLLAAENQILEFGYNSGDKFDQAKLDQAVKTVLAADDSRDAAAVGMSLAIRWLKGDYSGIRQASITILRGLHSGEGKRLANLLARTDQARRETDKVRNVAAVLGEPDKPDTGEAQACRRFAGAGPDNRWNGGEAAGPRRLEQGQLPDWAV